VVQLADSLALIDAGHVVGCGTLSEIAARADLPLARSQVTHDAIVRLALSPGGPVLALIKSTSIEVRGG
jgi:ABC-type molybdate transport system ATPase subunit